MTCGFTQEKLHVLTLQEYAGVKISFLVFADKFESVIFKTSNMSINTDEQIEV